MHTVRPFRVALLSATVALAFAADIGSAQAWKFKTLYQFKNGADGSGPKGDLVRDTASGNLYGVTGSGGTVCDDDGGEQGCGVVFKLAPDGTETVLHTFTGGKDGAIPLGGFTQDNAGNLYGTTWKGGKSDSGIVFKLAPDGSYTILHAFDGHDGISPDQIVWDSASGNLYGAASTGVFKLTAKGRYSALHVFAYLTLDGHHRFYGTNWGGDGPCQCGSVFTMTPKGEETILYNFPKKQRGYPDGPLIIGDKGSLYGATDGGKNTGSFFVVTLDGKYHMLHRFSGIEFAFGALAVDAAGAMYGTTHAGGKGEVIFQINPDGSEQTLYTFGHLAAPQGVIMDEGGNLYGEAEAASTIFELEK